jgi:hypothetical protein
MPDILDIAVSAAVFVLDHKLLVIVAGFLVGICGAAFTAHPRLRRLRPLAGVVFSVLLLASLFLGTPIRNRLIQYAGLAGEGMITQTSDTSSTYNEQTVLRFDTILRLSDGSTVKTQFHSDDFNVVEGRDWNLTQYPNAGERFRVRYLSHNPEAFVVLTDTESEYGLRLLAGERQEEIQALENQLKMAPEDAAARTRLEELVKADASQRETYQASTRQ